MDINRKERIRNILNEDYNKNLDEDEKVVIDNISFSYSETSCSHSDKVQSNLYSNEISFSRDGLKEMSYESWVDTHWFDWEED